jgi:uncharacterized membrane protein (UPF0136 family)
MFGTDALKEGTGGYMKQGLLVEIVNGFTIGILIGSAWYLQARIITRIFFVIFIAIIAVLVICIAREVS